VLQLCQLKQANFAQEDGESLNLAPKKWLRDLSSILFLFHFRSRSVCFYFVFFSELNSCLREINGKRLRGRVLRVDFATKEHLDWFVNSQKRKRFPRATPKVASQQSLSSQPNILPLTTQTSGLWVSVVNFIVFVVNEHSNFVH
jgi:hypothetical protein